MYDNQVYDLVELPPHRKDDGSKWTFKKNINIDGNVKIFKARLFVKGYTQIHGIDYDDTFSPNSKIKSIKIIMAIVTFTTNICHMDIKTAFLNGYHEEHVYIEQLEGFVKPDNLKNMCKLKKSNYGLKQATRTWYHHFDEKVKRFGFSQSPDEPCVYTKASGSKIVFPILYIDDILLIGNDIPTTLKESKAYLIMSFQIIDIREEIYILGIKIY